MMSRAASRTPGGEDNTKGLVHIYVDSVKGELCNLKRDWDYDR